MVRPYAIKGRKRKKNKTERYDKEEDEEDNVGFVEEEEEGGEGEKDGAQKKLKGGVTESDEEKAEAAVQELAGIPVNLNEQVGNDMNTPGVIFILEKASLEVAKVGKSYQLLNSEDHANFLRKNNRNPAEYRPDISHQAILNILDSPLNKAGRLKALYVRTEKGVLFEIKPHVRIPRTFKRFAGIMLQLLQKLSISTVGKREKLMRVIKNPVTQYLPVNSRKIGFSHSSEKLVDMHDYVATLDKDATLVFVVGAMAHGKIENDFVEDYISISGYPLSAAYCITRITNALERKHKIL
ncbi:ribosomal RNA small subunit methyltransferase nep-1 [Cynara cardunculus var. scolymus]|uniref:Ribosomal biogenesis, methyltransferase, EMG1/NEP1 n=1 Tax=Cynara cardunculus var. scolymus TaxID=59895 RepID=A0A118JTX8_CYNCS|nr:ribosomal RNA small subunit methyltransferase nep-1 [Cynara cardunculus var. scolymus]XP_024997069.1 ribosomal RNA small subunit methyltransferase nep-1 [Cynara cardunculus var. scolymus]XP_024997070.1 ribosomal RNA small subunit methyltransferase nep-1 [Cynara cardunculus var. scolymus]XP_024997071.1 ribosomal RNA small subunit methyltransferase nep-1 [Cynara cardunculus var. scolymus]KVH91732.1 Ribosomal biogenesis, methyltransferase, EMG1/NEP1 [Cynara cardunculus var. scolymus]